MPGNQPSGKHLLKVHFVGGLICVLIAGASMYFAGSSISKRRGLFFSARHELANVKSQLNESVKQRTSLAGRVQVLEQESATKLELVSVKQLNARTAEIVSLAELLDIRIDSLQPEERILDKRVPVQPLVFKGASDADDVFAFLGLMSEQMPDIHIHSIDILSSSIDSSTVQIEMQMYWFVDPADAGS